MEISTPDAINTLKFMMVSEINLLSEIKEKFTSEYNIEVSQCVYDCIKDIIDDRRKIILSLSTAISKMENEQNIL